MLNDEEPNTVRAALAVLDLNNRTGTPARNNATRERDFTGSVPERWWAGGAPGVWPFRAAKTIFALEELCRLIDIKSHGKPPGHHVMPQPRDIHAPGLAEAWWKPNDMHTPILLQRLLRGELRAFGIPGRVGATVPEWIAPRSWRDLKSDPNKQEHFEGGGNVYWHVQVVLADQVASEGAGPAPAAAPAATGLLPYPEATHWLAWNAASWRAFGTLDTPEHIVRHRSFDHGTDKLPDESDADHAARQDEHRRFDAAECELMDLLASGRIKAKGQPPAEGAPHEAEHGSHVYVPADAFLDRRLAFDPAGKLIVRLERMGRLFPPLELRGTKASPEHPLWHDLLIEAAGLREAWGIPGVAGLLPTPGQLSPPTADAPAPAPRKRKHPGQDWRADDAPLVQEMRRMVDANEAPSATNAARAVVERAKGVGKPGSKVARLVALYGKTHPAV